jgi:hypothetical protein
MKPRNYDVIKRFRNYVTTLIGDHSAATTVVDVSSAIDVFNVYGVPALALRPCCSLACLLLLMHRLLLAPLRLFVSLMLTSLSLMLFPPILASLLFLAFYDGPGVSCAAVPVGLAVAGIFIAVVSSLGSLASAVARVSAVAAVTSIFS